MAQSALEYIRTIENLRDVWREFAGRGASNPPQESMG